MDKKTDKLKTSQKIVHREMKRKKIYIQKIVLQEAVVTVLVLTSIIVVSCFEMLLCLQMFKQMKHNTMHAKRSEKSVNVRE